MIAHRIAAALVVFLFANVAVAQTGPQLLTVFPPGAKAGETIEITFSGAGFDGDEKLLFSDKDFKAERRRGNSRSKGTERYGASSVRVQAHVTKRYADGTSDARREQVWHLESACGCREQSD